MPPVVIYAVGSALVVEVEETCRRLGRPIAALVKNLDGPSFATAAAPLIAPHELDAGLRACDFVVPLFTPGHRKAAFDEAARHGLTRPAVLIDPTAILASSVAAAEGVYVNAGVVIGALSRLGRAVLINRGASLGHHAEVADFVSVGPGAVIAGHARIGQGAMIGAGAVLAPSIEIGGNAVVAAGAVVTRPVPANTLVAGNPARIVRSGIAGYRSVPA